MYFVISNGLRLSEGTFEFNIFVNKCLPFPAAKAAKKNGYIINERRKMEKGYQIL